MQSEDTGRGPTIRVIMGTSKASRGGEIHIDGDLLLDDAALAQRARIRRCQEEHLEAATADTCNVLDCSFDSAECSKAAVDWLIAHRFDERLMRELDDDPTRGRDPKKITSLICMDFDWLRVAEGIPELRSMAFSHLRGFSLVVRRDEMFRFAMEVGTAEAYFGLLRMLRVTGLEIPEELKDELVESLARDGMALEPWEDLLGIAEPDEFELAPAMIAARDCAKLASAEDWSDWNQAEYWLLGVLQVLLGRVILPRRYGFDEREASEYDQDAEAARAVLAEYGLNLRGFEEELRRALRQLQGSGRDAWRRCCEKAQAQAQSRGVQGVWASDVTAICLEEQSEAVRMAVARYRARCR